MKRRITLAVIVFLLMSFLTACGDVKMKKSSAELIGDNYESVIKELQDMGFKKITQDEVDDLTSDGPMKDGTVESVSVNGETSFEADAKFPKDSEVVVRYHIIKKIASPIGSDGIEDKDYITLANLFKNSGFTNVQTKEVYDIDPEAQEKDHISEIIINNKSSFNKNDPIPFDAEIIVNCHLFYKIYKLTLKIDFIPNLIFNKSDVGFYVDGKEIATLEHGKDWSGELSLKQGTYELLFKSVDDSTVTASTELELDCDIEAEYEISILFSGMHIEEKYIDRKVDLAENQAKVTCSESDFKDRDYKKVSDEIKKLGFTNITETPVYDSFSDSNVGKVINVSINGSKDYRRGNIFDSDTEVVITYHMKYEDDPEIIAEKKKAEEEEKKKAEGEKTKEEATDTNKTESGKKEDSTSTSDKSGEQKNSGVPVMKGSNVDTAISKADNFGLTRAHEDQDFGHGTKNCELINSDGSLMLDIIYLVETKELLCARIITVNNISSDEQYQFIKDMSVVLCPKNSSDSVKTWVESNIGNTADTIIDNMDYLLSFGPTNNALYSAGNDSWEKWELSQ